MVAGRKLSSPPWSSRLSARGSFRHLHRGGRVRVLRGWSAIWQPAGAFLGIAIIYFIAGKIRTFGQYTVGDILEVRYGKFARLFGAIALIIAFTTMSRTVSGWRLHPQHRDRCRVSLEVGRRSPLACDSLRDDRGMVAVAHTDLPNGIIIVLACCLALPFVVLAAGGWSHAAQVSRRELRVFSPDFGKYPALKGLSTSCQRSCCSWVCSHVPKFYAARSPKEARRAVLSGSSAPSSSRRS